MSYPTYSLTKKKTWDQSLANSRYLHTHGVCDHIPKKKKNTTKKKASSQYENQPKEITVSFVEINTKKYTRYIFGCKCMCSTK